MLEKNLVRYKSIAPIPLPVSLHTSFYATRTDAAIKNYPILFLRTLESWKQESPALFSRPKEREVKSECFPTDDASRACKNVVRRATKKRCQVISDAVYARRHTSLSKDNLGRK